MIVWLASYPRSGNHLLRTILQQSFGLESYEIYQKIARPMDEALSSVIGAKRFEEEDVQVFLRRARAAPELFLVKTHGSIPEGDRCIYILRDGRASLLSYQRYIAEVEGHEVELADLIAGRHWPGDWHSHVTEFLARPAENTLVLRYEDLASDKPPLDAIGKFLKADAARPFDITFAQLQAMNPKIFRSGNNRGGIETIERRHPWLFWLHCGATMKRLGYLPKPRDGVGHAGALLRRLVILASTRLTPAARSWLTGPMPQRDRAKRIP